MIAMVMVIAILIFSILASGIVALAQAQSVTNMPDSMGLRIWDVNSSTTDGRNIYTILGKVFNNDTVPFNGVRVSATLYDNNGQILVERSAYSSPSGVQPGMNATFEINVFGTVIEGGINAITNFTTQVTGDRQELLFQ
jgi:ABC-type transport system involved in multi-copper enzyme maturation permease subunit